MRSVFFLSRDKFEMINTNILSVDLDESTDNIASVRLNVYFRLNAHAHTHKGRYFYHEWSQNSIICDNCFRIF